MDRTCISLALSRYGLAHDELRFTEMLAGRFWVFPLTHLSWRNRLQIPSAPSHTSSTSFSHSTAIMCATCNEAVANGNTNGSSTNDTNGTNGTNGSSHDGFTSIKSSHNPVPHHKSSPYAPVGDFLSNVSRFKIIGTSPVTLPSAIGDAHRRNLRFVFELATERG
jgi:hypothetical protein